MQTAAKNSQRKGELPEGAKVKDQVDSFFASCDNNGDMRCSLKEYKQLWGFKLKKKPAESEDEESRSFISELTSRVWQIPADLERLAKSAREYAKQSPQAALAGVGATSAAVYIGGMVAHVW